MARRVAIVEMPCKLTYIFLKCRMYRRIFVVSEKMMYLCGSGILVQTIFCYIFEK